MDDKRQSRRISYACEVACTGVGMGLSPLNPRISDLSATGAFVDCMTEIPQGARVKLVFKLDGREIATTAQVAHAMPGFGMGVRFLDLKEEDRNAIEDVVRSH